MKILCKYIVVSAIVLNLCTASASAADKMFKEFYDLSLKTIVRCTKKGIHYYNNIDSELELNGTNPRSIAGSEVVNQAVMECVKHSLERNTINLSPDTQSFVCKILTNEISATYFYNIAFCGFTSAYIRLRLLRKKLLTKNEISEIAKDCALKNIYDYDNRFRQ